MIIFDDVRKLAGKGAKKREVLAGVSLRIPSNRRIAVLGPSSQDKKTLIDLLAGSELPTSGSIIRNSRVSFQVGQLSGFSRELSLRLNVAHVARLYGADVDATVNFVEQVVDMGSAFDRPYGSLPSRQRREIGQILAYSIPFDVYVMGEEIARPGQRQFKKAPYALFEARARDSGMIIVTRDREFTREFCDMALLIEDGQITIFRDMESALAATERLPPKERAERLQARRGQLTEKRQQLEEKRAARLAKPVRSPAGRAKRLAARLGRAGKRRSPE